MTPQEIQKLQDRVTKLESLLNEIIRPDRYVFNRAVQFNGTKLGFYGGALLGQPTVETSVINTVSGSGADATINANFSSLDDAVNSIGFSLRDLGLCNG